MKREELRLVGNGVSELFASEHFYIQTLQGSVTRSQAWKDLQDSGRVGQNTLIEGQQHALREVLTSKLSALDEATWTKELDMYSGLVIAIKDGLYKEKDIFLVDTSQRNDFPADVSVAAYEDARLPYRAILRSVLF